MASKRYESIDVLRGLAALTVLFSHYVPHVYATSGDIPLLVTKEFGHYAVKLFFAISGFVIFYSLAKCRTVIDFAVLRFSRLYPTYWVAVVFSSVILAVFLAVPYWPGGLVVNLTMMQEFLGFPHLDAVYWSLTVELAFYLNVAWLFALGWHVRTLSIASIWLAATALWSVTLFEFTPGNNVRSGWLALLFALDYSPYFAMGIVFHHVERKGWSYVPAGLLVAAIGVEWLLFSIEGTLVAASIATIFFLAVGGYLRLLICRPTLWLGSISYSLYLLHRNLGFATLNALIPYMPGVAALALATLLALLLASASTLLVERPALSWIRSKYALRRDWKNRLGN